MKVVRLNGLCLFGEPLPFLLMCCVTSCFKAADCGDFVNKQNQHISPHLNKTISSLHWCHTNKYMRTFAQKNVGLWGNLETWVVWLVLLGPQLSASYSQSVQMTLSKHFCERIIQDCRKEALRKSHYTIQPESFNGHWWINSTPYPSTSYPAAWRWA